MNHPSWSGHPESLKAARRRAMRAADIELRVAYAELRAAVVAYLEQRAKPPDTPAGRRGR